MKRDAFDEGDQTRRRFLGAAASTAGLIVSGCGAAGAAEGRGERQSGGAHEEAEVTPGEDLMQEHGVLERVLLVYDEAAGRLERNEALDRSVVTRAAGIVRRFVEEYHERLEERFVFPRLEAARREAELVAVLRRQHQRGREITDQIVRDAGAGSAPSLARLLRGFQRMYRPHAAREDTVLFPAFRDVVGRAEYRELGEKFESEEHARFGERGFADTVAEVAGLEAALGIADLARFTP